MLDSEWGQSRAWWKGKVRRNHSPDALDAMAREMAEELKNLKVTTALKSPDVFARAIEIMSPELPSRLLVALGLGGAACQKGMPVSFVTAASLVHELMEARDEKRLLRLQRQLAKVKLLIIDELGFVPLSKTGAELLFELISQRYECGSTLITSNLPFEEWTETFGSERLTGALLDRLTHHVNILEMNGESYRLNQSRSRLARANK